MYVPTTTASMRVCITPPKRRLLRRRSLQTLSYSLPVSRCDKRWPLPARIGLIGKICVITRYRPSSNRQPRCVIFAGLKSKFQVGAQKSGPEFGNQFLDCLTFAAEAMPTEVTVEPGLGACPMGSLMGKRPVITVSVLEALERRHLDRVSGDAVERTTSAMSDGCSQWCEERFRVLDAGNWVECRRGFRVINFRQAVDLLDVENGVPLKEGIAKWLADDVGGNQSSVPGRLSIDHHRTAPKRPVSVAASLRVSEGLAFYNEPLYKAVLDRLIFRVPVPQNLAKEKLEWRSVNDCRLETRCSAT